MYKEYAHIKSRTRISDACCLFGSSRLDVLCFVPDSRGQKATYEHKDRTFWCQGPNMRRIPEVMLCRILMFMWCSGGPFVGLSYYLHVHQPEGPQILGLLGLNKGFGTLKLRFGRTLDVEG